MSELSLLIFGCMVSFIAAAGAYVYVRECFTAEERARKVPVRIDESKPRKLKEVA